MACVLSRNTWKKGTPLWARMARLLSFQQVTLGPSSVMKVLQSGND